MIEHHITGLKVTIEETIDSRRLQIPGDNILICCQVFRKKTEVCFKFQLMKVDLCGLQETIFEIIQVEEHTINIELRLRITVGKVEFAGSSDLHIRQFTDCTLQQFLFLKGITSSSLTTTTDGIKKRHTAEVCLEISQLVITGSQNLRYGKFTTAEVLRQIDKSVIFITTSTDNAHNGLTIIVSQTIISTITAATRNPLNISRLSPLPLPI